MAKFLSDEEMEKLESRPQPSRAPSKSKKFISDDEMMELAPDEGESFTDGLIDTAVSVGNFVDSYTGAPSRSALSAIQDGKNPISAFSSQFGDDPSLAPTGKEIAQKFGVADTALSEVVPSLFTDDDKEAEKILKFKRGGPADITKSGVAGLGLDVATDWTNIVPVSAAAKALVKGTTKSAKLATKGTAKVADAIAGSEKFSKGVDYAGDLAATTTQSLKKIFSPKRADDFKEMADIAARNGIDPAMLPESVEFGPDSFISRAARNRAEGVGGEPHLNKFREAHKQVQRAIDNRISEIGGTGPLSAVDAGDLIRQGFDDGVERFFSQMDITHDTVQAMAPGLTLADDAQKALDSTVNGLEKWAKGRSVRGITATQREQAKQILGAIGALRAGNGSYKQTVEALRDIGEVAFKTSNTLADVPPDIQRLRKLYGDVNDALLKTVKSSLGDDIAKQLVDNNKLMSELLGDKSLLGKTIGQTAKSPERLFQELILNGDTKRIEALKRVLAPEQIQALKGAFLENLIKRDPDGAFTFRSLYSALEKKKHIAAELFGPEELKEIVDLIRLGDRFGNPVLSSSGTGASNIFRAIPQAISEGIANSTIIDSMKATARGAAELPQAAAVPQGPVVEFVNGSVRTKPRGRASLAAKGAQVLSVQDTSQERSQSSTDAVRMLKDPAARKHQSIDGFEPSTVMDVPPDALGDAEESIRSSTLSNIEKAKRLNLLRKHGKAVLND